MGSIYEAMTGYMSSMGVHARECHVGKILREIHQPYHEFQHQGARNLNPVPYHVEYMDHKLHLHQSEKLGMFGVTHVLTVDGYSSKIVASSTIPVKNNLVIYDEVYSQREGTGLDDVLDKIEVVVLAAQGLQEVSNTMKELMELEKVQPQNNCFPDRSPSNNY